MNSYLRKKSTMKDRRELIRRVLLGRTFRSFISLAMFGLGVLYIWQINTVSAKGYIISDYEKKVSSLERETRSLDVAIAQHTSIKTVQDRLGEAHFEQVSNAEFVSLTDNAVARQ